MARLRQQAAGLPGVGGLAMLDDDTVIALLAGFARPGARAAAELPLRVLATPEESATPAPAPAAVRRAGAAAPSPSDDTFGEPLDPAAMAASLQEAAASGVPFCEQA